MGHGTRLTTTTAPHPHPRIPPPAPQGKLLIVIFSLFLGFKLFQKCFFVIFFFFFVSLIMLASVIKQFLECYCWRIILDHHPR